MPKGLVGKLSVGLSLSSGAFTKGLDKARRASNRFKKHTATIAAGVRVLGAGLAVAGVIAGRSVRNNLAYIDSLAKMSRRLGISTEKLSELHFAARLSGVEINALNTGLQRMVRRVTQASKGTGEAVDTLKELGLDATELAKLSPDKMFLRIADATSVLATEGEKVTAFFKLFDTEGVGLKVVAENGAAGIKKMAMQARAAGASIGGKMAKEVEKLNDEITKAKASFNAFGIELTRWLAGPAAGIVDAVKEMTAWLSKLRGNLPSGPDQKLQTHKTAFRRQGRDRTLLDDLIGTGALQKLPGMDNRLPLQSLRGLSSDAAVAELRGIRAAVEGGIPARAG